jgi:hypothetical protein
MVIAKSWYCFLTLALLILQDPRTTTFIGKTPYSTGTGKRIDSTCTMYWQGPVLFNTGSYRISGRVQGTCILVQPLPPSVLAEVLPGIGTSRRRGRVD